MLAVLTLGSGLGLLWAVKKKQKAAGIMLVVFVICAILLVTILMAQNNILRAKPENLESAEANVAQIEAEMNELLQSYNPDDGLDGLKDLCEQYTILNDELEIAKAEAERQDILNNPSEEKIRTMRFLIDFGLIPFLDLS